jgi:hypothetical protein
MRYLHPKTIGPKTDLFWSEKLERQMVTYTYCYIFYLFYGGEYKQSVSMSEYERSVNMCIWCSV